MLQASHPNYRPRYGNRGQTSSCRREAQGLWLSFIQDRYLSLCHNQRPIISEAECEKLPLPLDEISWQSGDTLAGGICFPLFEYTSPGIYGWLIPLMTITGTLATLTQVQRHDTLRMVVANAEYVRQDIAWQVEMFSRSLSSGGHQIIPSSLCNTSQVYTTVMSIQSLIHVLENLITFDWNHMNLDCARDIFKTIIRQSVACTNAIAAGTSHL